MDRPFKPTGFNRFEDLKYHISGAVIFMDDRTWSIVIIHKDQNNRIETYDNFKTYIDAKAKLDECFFNKRAGKSNIFDIKLQFGKKKKKK